jgi:hypothetical protein
MIEKDKILFKQMLDTVFEMHNRDLLTIEQMRVWWAKLSQYEFNIVSNAVATLTANSKFCPTLADIDKLCYIKPNDFAKIAPPRMSKEDSKIQSDKMMENISKTLKPTSDYKAWARCIMSNPKDYPAISLKFAKEALRVS